MSVGGNTWFRKQTSIHFKIKNISSIKKKITVLGISLYYGQIVDLLNYPTISEADVKEALIKGDLANKIRHGDIIIVSNSMDLLQFDDEQRQFIIDAGGTIGIDPNKVAKDSGQAYLELGPLGESVPPNSYFFDVDGTPSYTDESGDPHTLGSGGTGGTGPYHYINFSDQDFESVPDKSIFYSTDGDLTFKDVDGNLNNIGQPINQFDINSRYLSSLNVFIPTQSDLNEGAITLTPAHSQAIYHYIENTGLNTINLPSIGTITGDKVYLKIIAIGQIQVLDDGGFDHTYNHGYSPIIFTFDNSTGWSAINSVDDNVHDDDFYKGVNANTIQNSLEVVNDTVYFNYQRLNSVKHPIPSYNHGVTTVGWTRSQFLRTYKMTVTQDVRGGDEFPDELITLTRERWQSVSVINKVNNVTIQFPTTNLLDGDTILIYSEPGTTCTAIIWQDPYQNFVPPGYIIEFVYSQQENTWNTNFKDVDYWIKSVNKNTQIESGTVNIFFPLPGEGQGGYNQLSGTYNGDVICVGNAILTDKVNINGSLIVTNNLYNPQGHRTDVNGDMICDSIIYDPDEATSSQNDLSIGGDLICNNLNFEVVVFNEDGESHYPQLFVNGNLIVNGTIDAAGLDGAPGLSVFVNGNLNCTESIYLSGGDATDSLNAGNGGELDVSGNALFYFLESYGGDTHSTLPAGHGGSVSVFGDLTGAIFLDGGDATYESSTVGNNAGNGGGVYVYDDCSLQYLSSMGGACNSTSGSHVSGLGGSLQVGKSLYIYENNTVDLTGGARYGTLTESGIGQPPHGGSISVFGNIFAESTSIYIYGGEIDSDGFSPSTASSSARNINCKGSFYHSNIQMYGAPNGIANGGYGGALFVYGDLIGSGESGIYAHGGNGGEAHAGNSAGKGGNSQDFYIAGDASTYINISGGDSYNELGGSSSSLTCDGVYSGTILADGGSCNSTNSVHYAGNAATIVLRNGLHAIGSISAQGGSRYGATTQAANNVAPAGGNISISYGNFNGYGCNLNGGSVNTDYANGAGGNAGSITVYNGNINTSGELSLRGGDCTGANAGNGGNIDCKVGSIKSVNIYLNGGSGTTSTGDSSPGTAGSPGSLFARRGCDISSIEMLDGTTGQAATGAAAMMLAGNCNFGIFNAPDRPEIVIKRDSDNNNLSATVTFSQMLVKRTLNNADGSATPVVDTIGSLNSNIFKGSGDNWYVLAGTPMD